jgi:CMP-N,N'-diacetyllegionaminic acid synthase
MKIIIPARFGSKGFPLKNRELFKYTADIIPKSRVKDVWVTTDDDIIKLTAEEYKFNVVSRPAELATDTASIRDVMLHAVESIGTSTYDHITMLYLTYPQRTWQHVLNAYRFFVKHHDIGITNSLLCRKEVQVSPYLYLEESGAKGLFGKQLKDHDLYRRQDYPVCFEISHFISIFTSGELYKLNNNLYNGSTVFYKIPDMIDVDYRTDLKKLDDSND